MKLHFKTLCIAIISPLIAVSTAIGSPLKEDYKPIKEDYKPMKINFAEGTPTTSGVYDPMDPYMIGTEPWVAILRPLKPEYLSGFSVNFYDVLETKFPEKNGWSYKFSDTKLSDESLVVRTYDVEGNPAKVGAQFHVEYIPHGTDPKENIHWIQVVTDNHNITDNKGHGNPENIVDIDYLSFSTPYYDENGAATNSQFYDFSFRSDANMSHDWIANLFLVTGPAINTAPGPVTFYSGIDWGWENHPIPEPSTLLLAGMAFSVVVALRLRRLTRSDGTAVPESRIA